jgi:hypothetical protein
VLSLSLIVVYFGDESVMVSKCWYDVVWCIDMVGIVGDALGWPQSISVDMLCKMFIVYNINGVTL